MYIIVYLYVYHSIYIYVCVYYNIYIQVCIYVYDMLGICCFVLSKRPKVVPFGRGANAGGSDSQGASGGAILAWFTFGQKGIDLRLYDLINDI